MKIDLVYNFNDYDGKIVSRWEKNTKKFQFFWVKAPQIESKYWKEKSIVKFGISFHLLTIIHNFK